MFILKYVNQSPLHYNYASWGKITCAVIKSGCIQANRGSKPLYCEVKKWEHTQNVGNNPSLQRITVKQEINKV